MMVEDDLIKIRQEIALLRNFPSVSATLEFNEDETCGLAWTLDSWMERIDGVIAKLKQ